MRFVAEFSILINAEPVIWIEEFCRFCIETLNWYVLSGDIEPAWILIDDRYESGTPSYVNNVWFIKHDEFNESIGNIGSFAVEES